jgi:hypothetical protein
VVGLASNGRETTAKGKKKNKKEKVEQSDQQQLKRVHSPMWLAQRAFRRRVCLLVLGAPQGREKSMQVHAESRGVFGRVALASAARRAGCGQPEPGENGPPLLVWCAGPIQPAPTEIVFGGEAEEFDWRRGGMARAVARQHGERGAGEAMDELR